MRNLKLLLAPITLAMIISGCGPKANDTTQAAETGAADLASDAAVTASDAAADIKQALTPTPTGQEFADTAAKSDAFEIAEAKLVEMQSKSPALKHFAMMMMKDHHQSTALIKQAAGEASPVITPDATLSDSLNSKIADLKKLQGDDFGHAYIDQQIDAHKDALALMSNYAEKGEVASLKAAAGKIKPKVQMHLDAIKAIKGKMS